MSNKPKILIVDDDLVILDGLDDLLGEEYDVTKAENGKVALQLLKKNRFDLAILDIMMPEMDGYDLANHIQKDKIDIPFIFLSAKTQNESKVKGLELGAEDYIYKPFLKEELRLKIKRKLHTQQEINLRNKRLELIHHNILTPIGVIQGYLEILDVLIIKTDKTITSNKISDNAYMISDQDWKNLKNQYYSNTKKMYHATGELISIIKRFMETQVYKDFDIPLLKSSIKLENLIYNAVSSVKPNKLQCYTPESFPNIDLIVDINKINQVIFEIFDNAVLHNDQNQPTVEISVKIDENNIIFSFTDNARGIPSNDFQNVFDEFWSGYEKLHHTRGEGIGLWICKTYINIHKGHIWIEKSEIGKGTTICFSLPI